MLLRNRDQFYLAVETAVEGEVRFLRIDAGIVLVVYRDCDDRISFICAEIDAERGITTVMMICVNAVDVDVCPHCGAVEFKVYALTGQFFLTQFSDIPAGSAVIVISAVLTVDGIPGMRKRDDLSLRMHGLFNVSSLLYKLPSVA